MSKLHIENWTLSDGREVPFRVAKSNEKLPLSIPQSAVAQAKPGDVYGCAVAVQCGLLTGLTTEKQRKEWGQGVWWHKIILAQPDIESPVGRTRVLYQYPEDIAKLIDTMREAEPQTINIRGLSQSQTPETTRVKAHERKARIASGEHVVTPRKMPRRVRTEVPTRPRLQRNHVEA
jgi:hypothetical protein